MKKVSLVFAPAVAVLSGILALGVFAQERDLPTVRANNQTTRDALQQSMSVSFFETRFEEVLQFLKQQTDVQFLLHESAMENNLDEDSLLTLTLEDTRTTTCIDLMLEPYMCSYAIQDGIVIIMSEDACLERLTLRVFNCRDLIAAIHPKRRLSDDRYGRMADGGFGRRKRTDMGGGVFNVPQDEQKQRPANPFDEALEKPTDETAADEGTSESDQPLLNEVSGKEQLIELIQQMVDPDSWDVNGGSGRVYEINGMIIVSQTEKNLRQIESLLDEITPQMK